MVGNTYIVYMHIFPNNKKYIGITRQTPNQRWANGRGYQTQKLMSRAIEKYGWDNVEHIILFKNLTKENAERLEMVSIALFNSCNPLYGYNYDKGGNVRGPVREETKRKLSEANKGKVIPADVRKRISLSSSGEKAYWYGRHHTEETKEKNRIAHTGVNHVNYGKHLRNETKRKISKALTGNRNAPEKRTMCVETGVVYNSTREAARINNLRPSTISMCCRGERKTHGGFHWKYI